MSKLVKELSSVMDCTPLVLFRRNWLFKKSSVVLEVPKVLISKPSAPLTEVWVSSKLELVTSSTNVLLVL